MALEGLVNLRARTNEFKQAACKRVSDRHPRDEQAETNRIIFPGLAYPGEDVFTEAYDVGQEMTMDEAIKVGLFDN